MFLSVNESKPAEVPQDSGFSTSDWHVLAGFWHPVAISSEVQDKPVAAKLLGLNLVVYRTRDGVAVARDICAHRGAPLTLGWLDEDRTALVCPMHGHHYAADGHCSLVPSMGASARIPERMNLRPYLSAERYGFVWACLKPQPTRPLPYWPVLEPIAAGWKRFEHPRERWKAAAARQVENFNDVAHLSWVHLRTFGNRARPEIAPYEVERTDYGLRMDVPYHEVERGFNSEQLGERQVRYEYQLSYPFATQLRVDYDSDKTSYFYDIASPVSARECDVYGLSLTNIQDAGEDYASYSLLINDEDRPLVESQAPSQVPLNAGYEVSMPSDRMSIQYRRDLVELFGLGKLT